MLFLRAACLIGSIVIVTLSLPLVIGYGHHWLTTGKEPRKLGTRFGLIFATWCTFGYLSIPDLTGLANLPGLFVSTIFGYGIRMYGMDPSMHLARTITCAIINFVLYPPLAAWFFARHYERKENLRKFRQRKLIRNKQRTSEKK